jgi:transcription elongation factor Elf1
MPETVEKKITCWSCGQDNLVTINKDTEWFKCSYCGVENDIEFQTMEEVKMECLQLMREKLIKMNEEADKGKTLQEKAVELLQRDKNYKVIQNIIESFIASGKERQLMILKRKSDGSLEAYFVVEADEKEYKKVP